MMEVPVTLEKYTLRSLRPDVFNAFVVGVIIAKQSPRKLSDDRSVWNFTLRDSPQDFINVTCWGQKESVFLLNEKFQVGDVVEVVRPRIEIRRIDGRDEQYRPMVTSPFTLTLNDQSAILSHEGSDYPAYLKLLHYATKPLAKFVALADVHRKGCSETGAYGLDILGAVKNVGNVRVIKSKDDREIQVRDVVIFDHTNSELRFSIWDTDLSLRASTWTPRNTILFITDMRAKWSNFHRSVIAFITSKTIITENPIGSEANALRNFAETAPLQTDAIMAAVIANIPDPNTIQHIMNIVQLKEKLKMPTPNCQTQTQALVFAFITFFDLDGDSHNFSFRCGHCNNVISKFLNNCDNLQCPVGSGQIILEPHKTLDIRICLTDHSGTLDNCRLIGKFAEQTLNCDTKTFICKTQEEKMNLKWKFLMERYAIRLVAFPQTGGRQTISILNMTPVSPFEVAGKIPHY